MEVLIGFAAGYWVGTRQGRQGLQRAVDAAQGIWAHPETRRMLGEGLSAIETVAGPAMERLNSRSGNRGAFIGTVMDEIVERRQRRAA